MKFTYDLRDNNINLNTLEQVRALKTSDNECQFLKKYSNFFTDFATTHIRQEQLKFDKIQQHYRAQLDNDVYEFTRIQDEEKKFTVKKNDNNQFYCDCQFYNQFKLPCIHLLVVADFFLLELDEIPEKISDFVLVEPRHFKGFYNFYFLSFFYINYFYFLNRLIR